MTEGQVINAMELLAKLVAERKGFSNPEIIITKKKKASQELSMKGKIGFVLFLIGGAGLDGDQMIASAIVAGIGMLILLKESKKIDATTAKQKRLLNNTTMLFLCIIAQRKGIFNE